MEKHYEHQYHRVERVHWWFAARRQVVQSLVRDGSPDRKCRILEIGCSGGPLMAGLRGDGYGNVTGIDCSADAIEHCHKAGLEAQLMDAQKLSFPDESFEVIIASDILEHLPDDRGALLEWRRVLKPGGRLILFVPAFAFLWTDHDVVNRHCRRYERRSLLSALASTGFRVERSSYWNVFLFLPVVAVRFFKRRVMRKETAAAGIGDLFMPPRPLNAILLALLWVENVLFRCGVNWPLGVSVMALARRPLK